eukprot:TRINITY_DN6695_c0_g1_i1.p1 TRINITY_DN6695_c0_g1~~TRINITY_DN6695_c0_g1_i1.p1  ORF type:complete len:224 (+),score=89.87 TRINITY_DN6695_c0_g1_i1:81-752(+)
MNGRGSISEEEFLRRRSGLMQEERAAEIERVRREIEERTLDSSNRSLGLLYESEKVGIATAEELNRQKEQLKSTELRLDDINATLTQSERHLQGAKSVLGGIMNYFSGRSRAAPSHASSGGLKASLRPEPSPPPPLSTTNSSNSSTPRGPPPIYYNENNSEEILERNLDEMSMGLSRLKVLAHGLNKEMDEHNGILDRIDDGVGKNAWRIEKQNKDMSKLLKK